MSKMNLLIYLRWIGQKLSLSKDNIDRAKTSEAIAEGLEFSGINLWVLAIAMFIASLGLNVNSTAVIIGAMLISPLMGPIMGIGLGLGTLDLLMVRRAFRNWLAAFGISLFTSTIYFLVTPLKQAGSELLSRTQPTIYDVLIAFAGGLAGILAGSSRLRQSNVIPGVAIATALMPPICTAGYSLANGHWGDMAGALYLFIINSVFISLSTYMVVRLMKFPLKTYIDQVQQKKLRAVTSTIAILVIAPSIYLTYNLVRRYLYTDRIDKYLSAEFPSQERYILRRDLDFKRGFPELAVTVLGRPLDSVQISILHQKMSDYNLDGCKLLIQQGYQDTGRQTVLFDRVNQLLQGNTRAISTVYGMVDSIARLQGMHAPADSQQIQLAKESKAVLPELSRFYLTREIYYLPDSARFDTMLHVYAGFDTVVSPQREAQYLNWLRTRLATNKLVLEKKQNVNE